MALHLDRERTSALDVGHRGSYVALGAALHDARTAAAAHGALGPVTLFPDPARPDLVAELALVPGAGGDAGLAARHDAVLARTTDRAHGDPRRLDEATAAALHKAAAAEGARLHLLTPGPAMTAAGDVLAAADRRRYLTAHLHGQMFAELAWPGRGRLDAAIDVRTLGLDAADLATLQVAARPEVVALLAEWDAGSALGDDTRDRVASSSALAVVTVPGDSPADYVRGGAGAEAVWVVAGQHGLGVQPVSPLFLFSRGAGDDAALVPDRPEEAARLAAAFREATGVGEEVLALVLRLSHPRPGAREGVRSRRRPAHEVTLHG